MNVLYEDNHIIVAVKPPNVLSQSDITGDYDMLSMVKEYVKKKYNKPGNVYIGLVHRLDRPVGGAMVFARTSKAAARLSEQFSSRSTQKYYIAAAANELPDKGEFFDYISAGIINGKVLLNSLQLSQYKPAHLEYVRLAYSKNNNQSLALVSLHTGRKHQIRAQFAAHGYPIISDQRYNDNAAPGQIALWAIGLSFLHPTTKERMEFFADAPRALFKNFEGIIKDITQFSQVALNFTNSHI